MPDIGVRRFGGPLRGLAALRPDGDMPGRAVIRLEAAEPQCRKRRDGAQPARSRHRGWQRHSVRVPRRPPATP
ncbi:hypothetical protein ACU4GD_21130 [Cupriavidus basilensis]